MATSAALALRLRMTPEEHFCAITDGFQMGIQGIFKEIGPGQRIALVKVAADHFVAHQRPLRLAIDIAIWLFQIQSGKGGSNPALRTFYYRLLRLLSFNIHPLFVFDGPNKPLFKRNKRVGGPGVRVASVPEFLAKQLLKQFGFPWHVAPGEAEAECALLQQEGIVDAVLSEDVDTLMFGSGLTLRNWTPDNTSKTPTHVNLYKSEKTLETSGLDRDGMILVALMSGGDYIVEGIPGCGPKLACDAARAGFGRDLCALAKRKDAAALKQWRERLQHEVSTNESKFFSRKNSKLVIPDDFPNREVLGYYTNPCVSTPDTLARLRSDFRWDQDIDFAALRSFTAEAFDWRCLGGAKKYIRNLAPAILIRRLRMQGDIEQTVDEKAQEEQESSLVQAIHGKRSHAVTDGELEYRISFIPSDLVPIDLSIEDPDDDYIPAGGGDEQVEADAEWAAAFSATQAESAPASPTKKRNFRPYDPSQPEKLWILRQYLIAGCPLLLESYEFPPADAREFLKARRKAKAAAAPRKVNKTKKQDDMPQNALMAYTTITKARNDPTVAADKNEDAILRPLNSNVRSGEHTCEVESSLVPSETTFKLPSTQVPQNQPRLQGASKSFRQNEPQLEGERVNANRLCQSREQSAPETPRRRKRPSPELQTPGTQRTIRSYWSVASPRSPPHQSEVIDLISSPAPPREVNTAPTISTRDFEADYDATFENEHPVLSGLLDTVTKRRKRNRLRKSLSAPAQGSDENDDPLAVKSISRPSSPDVIDLSIDADLDNAYTTSLKDALDLPSPSLLFRQTFTQRLSSGAGQTKVHKSQDISLSRPQSSTQAISSHELATAIVRNELDGAKASKGPSHQQTKRFVQLRESLPGAWKEIEIEAVDLSGNCQTKPRRDGPISRWRASQVEILDLTGA